MVDWVVILPFVDVVPFVVSCANDVNCEVVVVEVVIGVTVIGLADCVVRDVIGVVAVVPELPVEPVLAEGDDALVAGAVCPELLSG